MKLEKCKACGADAIESGTCGKGVKCSNVQHCGVWGPFDDIDGAKWNALMSRSPAPSSDLRERAAIAALNGLLSDPHSSVVYDTAEEYAARAVTFADLLVAALKGGAA